MAVLLKRSGLVCEIRGNYGLADFLQTKPIFVIVTAMLNGDRMENHRFMWATVLSTLGFLLLAVDPSRPTL